MRYYKLFLLEFNEFSKVCGEKIKDFVANNQNIFNTFFYTLVNIVYNMRMLSILLTTGKIILYAEKLKIV